MAAPSLSRSATSAAILVLVLSLAAFLAVSSMKMDSATDDEPAHIAAGYLKVKFGHFDFFDEQPPLINSLSGLPLASRTYGLPAGWDTPDANPWRVGQLFLYRSGNDADRIIFLARLPIVGLFLLLAVLVYRWALELTGNRFAAAMSFVLAAFCPNLIAHGKVATVDMGATFFCALSAYLFLRFLHRPSKWRAAFAGLGLGFAVLTKVSALILLPWAALSFALFFAWDRERRAELVAAGLPRLLLIGAVALVTFEAVYLAEMSPGTIRTAYPNLPQAWWVRLEVPFLEYAKNVKAIARWVAEPYDKPQYLLGSFSQTGWRTYYLVAMLLKTPVTTLVLVIGALVGLVVPLVRRAFGAPGKAERWPLDVWALLLFVVMFLAVSCSSSLNIGLRYVLPVYPFLYVLVAPVALRAVSSSGRWRKATSGALAALVIGSAVAGVAAYPGYLGYFNEFVRSKDADRYLIDSNLDWGQDLKRLKRWVEANGVSRIHTRYFGGGSVLYEMGAKAKPLPTCEPVGPGYYAISRQFYRTGFLYPGTPRDCAKNFAAALPVALIGDSLLVFEIKP